MVVVVVFRLRLLVIVALVLAIVGGCVFPDFEKYEGKGSSTSSSGGDGGLLARSVQCDAIKCFVEAQFCCSNPSNPAVEGPTKCFAKDQPTFCPDVDGKTKFRLFCDGEEDCTSGQVCCFTTGEPDIACKASCDGAASVVVCTGNGEGQRGKCPTGKVCTGTLPLGGHRSCVSP